MKRLILAILLLTSFAPAQMKLWKASGGGSSTGVASDLFNRANGDITTGGSWSYATGSTDVSNGVAIYTNAIHTATTGRTLAYWNTGSFTDKQYSKITVTNPGAGGYFDLLTRVQSTGTAYYCSFNFTTAAVGIVSDAVGQYEYASTTGNAIGAGDQMSCEATGSTSGTISVVLKKNGTAIVTKTAITDVITGGKPGVGQASTGAYTSDFYADNFDGGNLP